MGHRFIFVITTRADAVLREANSMGKRAQVDGMAGAELRQSRSVRPREARLGWMDGRGVASDGGIWTATPHVGRNRPGVNFVLY